jgi:hypothetical protein
MLTQRVMVTGDPVGGMMIGLQAPHGAVSL